MRAWLPVALVLAAAAAGCSTESSDPSAGTSSSPAGLAGTSSSSATSTPSADPGEGTAASPSVATAVDDPLDWAPQPGADGATVTTNGAWTLTVPDGGASYTLSEGDRARPGDVPAGRQVVDGLLNDRWAVVVTQDRQEEQPQQATAVELATGREVVVDGSSQPPTTTGGTWALDGDRLAYATLRGRDYCLAILDLASGRAATGPCVGAREGFNGVQLSDAGDALLRFDLGATQRSCRTVVAVEGQRLAPFPTVPAAKARCGGAEGAWLEGPDGVGQIWAVVPQERRFEEAHFYARTGEEYVDLGPGDNGTLTLCGGAAYFARSAQTGDGTAALLRWDGTELATVYESHPGQAVIAGVQCGGSMLTLTSLATGGDETVTAPLR